MIERPSWSQKALPKAVSRLVYLYGALIVGSQAELYAKGLRPSSKHDWDIMVPWAWWRRAALKEVLGHEPLYLGQPITVGEHEEIRIEWWDPRFPEDVGAPVQRAPFSAM